MLPLAFNVQPVPIRMSLVQIALRLVSNVQLVLIRNRKELLFAPFVQLVPILTSLVQLVHQLALSVRLEPIHRWQALLTVPVVRRVLIRMLPV